MNEMILSGLLADPAECVQELPVIDDTYMLLGRGMDCFCKEGEEKLVFETFKNKNDFNLWGLGWIFNKAFELRWQKVSDEFRIIYTGEREHTPPALTQKGVEINLNDYKTTVKKYLLWGKRLQNHGEYGIQSTKPVYFETKIPRPLAYPVTGKEERVCLKVLEFISSRTSLPVHFRYLDLEPDRQP